MRRAVLMCAVVLLFLAMVGCGDNTSPRVSAIAYVHVNSTPTITSFATKQSLASRDAIERHGAKRSITTGTQYSINTMNVDGTGVKTVLTTDEYLGGVDLSRDGKKIAYTAYDATTSSYQVFVLDVATKQSTMLTSSTTSAYDAMFTPDGKSIIYRDYTGIVSGYYVAELWKVSVNGGAPTKITTSSGICLHEPHISVDGTQIVFDYHDATHSDAIGIVNIDGTNFKTVPNSTWVYTPALSTDKATVFYADWAESDPQVYSVKTDGTGARALVSTGYSIDPYPVGDTVLFGYDDGTYIDLDIYSMKPDGSSQKKLTSGGINYMHWSGD